MSYIPDAAIEAAAEAIRQHQYVTVIKGTPYLFARAAIEAAMPAIRESIAQEIEAAINNDRPEPYWTGMALAARIVRGGTP